jgi:RNA 2',3'-cyclic 3'-phosphodiesterase
MIQEKKTDSASIRSFICIEVPGSIRQRLEELQICLRRVGGEVSWVKVSNIHLTLKFLGDITSSSVEVIRKAVIHASTDLNPFEIRVSGTGCFPSARNPRVLWVGLTDVSRQLNLLHSEIDRQLAQNGFPSDHRQFSPHLTLGRFRTARNSQPVVEALLREGFEPKSFLADRVILMRSQLNAGGTIYTPLAQVGLDAGQLEQP